MSSGYTQNPVVINIPSVTIPEVGPSPVRIVCPSCHNNVSTEIEHKINNRTHLWALICCLCCGWIIVPFIYLSIAVKVFLIIAPTVVPILEPTISKIPSPMIE